MLFPEVNVFIDGGGHDCSGVKRYLKEFPGFHKIYVFEPNPVFYKSYIGSNMTLIRKAIWTSNCTLPFYVSKDDRQVASSLLSDKLCKVDYKCISYFYDQSIQAECVDFSEWMRDNIKPNYRVTLKLDIEGAEYDVLSKMLDEGTIQLVDKLFVEFHNQTVPGKEDTHQRLLVALMDIGLAPGYWD